MKQVKAPSTNRSGRRKFLERGVAAGVAVVGGGVLLNQSPVLAARREREREHDREDEGPGITHGDIAILRFLAALEIIETDLWQQYNELGGVNAANSGYVAALQVLDMDMPQYIADNTDDEFSHQAFIEAYLASKGAPTVNLDQFRKLPSSTAPGAQQIGRLTNLMQLSVDTSWWLRYRSSDNPDLGATFAQLIPSLATGQHTAIPRNEAELGDPKAISDHVQAIANTAGFHFAFIEQGGSSLYPKLAQRVTNLEVLRILLSIGPTETSHFQTWHDKAGNAPMVTDGDLMFPDLGSPALQVPATQANLIMPEPCTFLGSQFPFCSIIRPTATKGAAMDAVASLKADGLFMGQPKEFFDFMRDLAEDADAAVRQV
jgi:hypothetical protein